MKFILSLQIVPRYFDLEEPQSITYAGGNAISWTLRGFARYNPQLLLAALVKAMIGFNYQLCTAAYVSS